MNSVKSIFLCCSVNFRKNLINPRIYTVLAISVIFQYFSFGTMPQVCEYLEMTVSPWVFPFFLGNPSLIIVYGALAILLYCDAPFADGHTAFLVIRVGKRNWILGQMMYVFLSSFLYTGYHVLLSILMLVPYVRFSTEWGSVLRALAADSFQIFEQAGTTAAFTPNQLLMETFAPVFVMAISILLFWLGCVFIGMLIFCFRILFQNTLGVILGTVFTGLAYFACYMGQMVFGTWTYYLSPVLWGSINYIDWYEIGGIPTFPFIATAYCVIITGMSVISVAAFLKKDLMM